MKNHVLSIVTAVALLISPLINFAQASSLGTAAGFVLFSSNGAVTNGGVISQLTGNVGNNIGALSGFGNVDGVMHNVDAATIQCAADLQLAYDSLGSLSANFFPVSSILGSGDTLTAGIYAIPGVATLDSILYLDAAGNSAAQFIFKIPAAFSTTALAKVKLINGAQACNVFWRIDGAFTMSGGTLMSGTIMAHNAIDMTVKDTLEGRALSIAGAISVNGVFAYTPTGCGSPVLTGPTAPTFGSSGCFAIFSRNGAVTNSGITHVTGDVGTNVGLAMGYDELYVTGYIHPIPDGYTASAAADLLNIYTYLNTLPNDIELLYPAQFGRNLVLTPHTYIMNGAATFTDSLYLNAQGNANAVFVIKIKGALSTSTFSKVFLRNGTQAKNVYWMVDGAVSISDNSVFNGTIVCNNAAIDLATNVTLNGRALTTGGALSTAAVFVTSPSGNCNTLPVSWLYFRGKPAMDNVLLEWGTTNEINNGFFTIEKSTDGITFQTLGSVEALTVPGQAKYDYSLTDQQPYNITYYRISQTDKDGKRSYYRTIQVKMNMNQGFAVSHYVQNNYLYVQASGALPGNGSIELYSIDGKKIFTQNIILTKEVTRYKIDKQLQSGVYLINIAGHGARLYHAKVMVL